MPTRTPQPLWAPAIQVGVSRRGRKRLMLRRHRPLMIFSRVRPEVSSRLPRPTRARPRHPQPKVVRRLLVSHLSPTKVTACRVLERPRPSPLQPSRSHPRQLTPPAQRRCHRLPHRSERFRLFLLRRRRTCRLSLLIHPGLQPLLLPALPPHPRPTARVRCSRRPRARSRPRGSRAPRPLRHTPTGRWPRPSRRLPLAHRQATCRWRQTRRMIRLRSSLPCRAVRRPP